MAEAAEHRAPREKPEQMRTRFQRRKKEKLKSPRPISLELLNNENLTLIKHIFQGSTQ